MGDLPSVIGSYRVVRSIGEGGMGTVYEAVHEAIERRVAIKVLHREYASNPEFIARFFNEARAVNRVEHTGLVQVSDYGQQPDGTAYIVMEYLKGESLAQRIERCGRKLPAAEVIHLNLQIADALAAAHAKDIVHRDLKPENVMLVPDPHMPGGERTKLLDFGIAKVSLCISDGESALFLPYGEVAERWFGSLSRTSVARSSCCRRLRSSSTASLSSSSTAIGSCAASSNDKARVVLAFCTACKQSVHPLVCASHSASCQSRSIEGGLDSGSRLVATRSRCGLTGSCPLSLRCYRAFLVPRLSVAVVDGAFSP